MPSGTRDLRETWRTWRRGGETRDITPAEIAALRMHTVSSGGNILGGSIRCVTSRWNPKRSAALRAPNHLGFHLPFPSRVLKRCRELVRREVRSMCVIEEVDMNFENEKWLVVSVGDEWRVRWICKEKEENGKER